MSEQELFGLMAIAQEQQQAATLALKKLEERQAELEGIIAKARSAVEAMSNAGNASAVLIEKATKNAVEKAVQGALESIQQQTRSTLADSVNSAVKALQGVTAHAEQAEENLHQAATWGSGSNGTVNALKPSTCPQTSALSGEYDKTTVL